MLYGQQDLLTDEPSPVSGPWDEAFDADILELMERQQAFLGEFSFSLFEVRRTYPSIQP